MIDHILSICVDGPDGVGKSTVIKELYKQMNYRYVVYDRGPLSNIVYCREAGRPESDVVRFQQALAVTDSTITIMLVAKPETIRERMSKRGEGEIQHGTLESNINAFEACYAEVASKFGLRNLFRLETDKIDPPMIAKIIMSWIQDDIGRYSIGNTFEVENYVNVYGVDDYKSIVPTVEPYDSIHKHPNDPTMWQYVESKSRKVVSNMYSEFCFQQLPRLLRELRASPPSRRAAIYYPLLDPNTCVVYALFKTRWNSTCNVVNCTCHVRSNDSQRGFYFDLAWHSYLLRTLSSMLGMKPGTIRWVVDSFHEYVTHSSFLSNSVEQVDDGLEQKIVRNLSDAPSEYAKLDPRDV